MNKESLKHLYFIRNQEINLNKQHAALVFLSIIIQITLYGCHPNFRYFSKLNNKDSLFLPNKICNKKYVQGFFGFLNELICPICYEIVADPKSCKNCEQSFCDLCITKWKKQSFYTYCPCCREQLKIVQPLKQIKIFLKKLIFSCINEERGCNQKSFYSELKLHQKYCDYQIQSCPNQGCSQEFIQKDEKKHLIECLFENVKCKGCQEYFKRKDLDFHEKQESCQYLMPHCQFCNQYMPLNEYFLHFLKCEEEHNKNNQIAHKLEKPEQFDKHKKKQKSIKQFMSS